MYNYAKIREQKKLFDVSLKSFSETYDMAVIKHSAKFIKVPFFVSDEDRASAREDAELEVRDMPWEQIQQLAIQLETDIEMLADDEKVEDMQFKETIWRTNNG